MAPPKQHSVLPMQGTKEREGGSPPYAERREEEGGGIGSRWGSGRRVRRTGGGRGDGAPPPLGGRDMPEDKAQIIVYNILKAPLGGGPPIG